MKTVMDTQNNKSEKDPVFEFFFKCIRHWYYFAICGIICAIIGVIYLKTTNSVYKIAAQVSLRHDDSMGGSGMGRVQGSNMLSMLGVGRGSDNIEDETAIMQSQGHIKDVVRQLNLNVFYTQLECFGWKKTALFGSSPVLMNADPAIPDTLTKSLTAIVEVNKDGSATATMKRGKKVLDKVAIQSFPATVQTAFGTFTFSAADNFQGYKKPFKLKIDYTNYDYTAQVFRKLLDIDFDKRTSDRILMSVENENVNWGKQLLSTVIDVYNRKWDADKEYGYTQTIDFINNRLTTTTVELSLADKAIQEFKDRYNLTDIEADVKYYFSMSGELQAELLTTEAQLKMLNVVIDFVGSEQNQYSLIPFNMSNANTAVAAVIEKYNEALLKRNEFYRNNSKSAVAQSIDSNLEAQRKNLIQSLSNEQKGLQLALDALRKKDAELGRKLGNIPVVERDFINLKREQEVQQTVYIFLLEKREETAVRFSALMPKLKIIDAPYALNKLAKPDKIVTAMVVAGASLITGLLMIFCMPYIRVFRKKEDK